MSLMETKHVVVKQEMDVDSWEGNPDHSELPHPGVKGHSKDCLVASNGDSRTPALSQVTLEDARQGLLTAIIYITANADIDNIHVHTLQNLIRIIDNVGVVYKQQEMPRTRSQGLSVDSMSFYSNLNVTDDADVKEHSTAASPLVECPTESQQEVQNKRHQCTLCARSFRSQGLLRRHLLTHTEDRPYKCSTCGVGFKRRYVLTEHMKTHSGEPMIVETYSCDICCKTFTRSTSLTRHKLNVHGIKARGKKPIKKIQVKSYPCDICQKTFTRGRSLREHKSNIHCTGEGQIRLIHNEHSHGTEESADEHERTEDENPDEHQEDKCGTLMGQLQQHEEQQKQQQQRDENYTEIKQEVVNYSSESQQWQQQEQFLQDSKSYPNKVISNIDDDEHLDGTVISTSRLHKEYVVLQVGNSQNNIYSNGTISGTGGTSFQPNLTDLHNSAERQYVVCDENFDTDDALQSHDITHTGERSSLCDESPETNKTDTFVHNIENVPDMQEQTDHQQMNCPGGTELEWKSDKQGNNAHTCVKCHKSFLRRRTLKRHVLTHSAVQPFKCSVCSHTFRRRHVLKSHMEKNHPGSTEQFSSMFSKAKASREHKCSGCDKVFMTRSGLSKHSVIHDKKAYRCPVCCQAFRRSYVMKNHMKKHRGEYVEKKDHQCAECGKCFSRPSDLDRHTLLHTGEKPHVCQVCGRGFRRSDFLIVHMRTHTDERPYTCTVCGIRCRTSCRLSDHSLIHTGEKRHQCAICHKRFAKKANCRLHQAKHASNDA